MQMLHFLLRSFSLKNGCVLQTGQSFLIHKTPKIHDPFSIPVTPVSSYNHTMSTNKAAKIEGTDVNILMTI
jgi:hypothetical protein